MHEITGNFQPEDSFVFIMSKVSRFFHSKHQLVKSVLEPNGLSSHPELFRFP